MTLSSNKLPQQSGTTYSDIETTIKRTRRYDSCPFYNVREELARATACGYRGLKQELQGQHEYASNAAGNLSLAMRMSKAMRVSKHTQRVRWTLDVGQIRRGV
jgi:hypothetical protein